MKISKHHLHSLGTLILRIRKTGTKMLYRVEYSNVYPI